MTASKFLEDEEGLRGVNGDRNFGGIRLKKRVVESGGGGNGGDIIKIFRGGNGARF